MENIVPSRVSTAGKLMKNAIVALATNLLLSIIIMVAFIKEQKEVSQNMLTVFGIISLSLILYSLYELYHAGDYLQKSYWESEDETAS
jgi:hypothetical protein